MSRFSASRTYLTAAAISFGLAVFSATCALSWTPALIPAALLLASALLVLWLAMRPAIELRESGITIGMERIAWNEIRRVDRTGWVSPLVLHLVLASGRRLRLVYPGEPAMCSRLLRIIQQRSAQALIDGVPHSQLWGQPAQAAELGRPLPAPRVRLMTEEDEAEVERLYQKLRAAGHLDPEK
jgi:hypothetical protein